MFKRLMNECTIDLTLRPKGAMLIKSGLAQVTGVDMAWVRVYRGGDSQVYLPGSSLKGTIRSHAERIARTSNDKAACNPFGGHHDNVHSCGTALEKYQRREKDFEMNMQASYRKSCPICRLFGNTQMMGRLATEDAYVKEGSKAPEAQQRDGVGIDRFTGGAARGAKFELEVITEGEFTTALHLQNFELWQLGLLGFVLYDLKDGLVRMGSGKSRGMGKVEAEMTGVTLSYLGACVKPAENGSINLHGVGALLHAQELRRREMQQKKQEREPEERRKEQQKAEQEWKKYGMQADDAITHKNGKYEIPNQELAGLRQTAKFTFDNFPWQEVAKKWTDFVQNFSDPLHEYRGDGHGG